MKANKCGCCLVYAGLCRFMLCVRPTCHGQYRTRSACVSKRRGLIKLGHASVRLWEWICATGGEHSCCFD